MVQDNPWSEPVWLFFQRQAARTNKGRKETTPEGTMCGMLQSQKLLKDYWRDNKSQIKDPIASTELCL